MILNRNYKQYLLSTKSPVAHEALKASAVPAENRFWIMQMFWSQLGHNNKDNNNDNNNNDSSRSTTTTTTTTTCQLPNSNSNSIKKEKQERMGSRTKPNQSLYANVKNCLCSSMRGWS